MTRTPVRSLASALLASLVASTVASAVVCPNPASMMIPPNPDAYTHEAFVSGDWDDPDTWDDPGSMATPTVPGDDAIVFIPDNIEVTVKTQETSRLRYVRVEGILRFWTAGSSRLYVDTLVVDDDNNTLDGKLVIGGPSDPVGENYTAEIVFIAWDDNPIDLGDDPEELGRGLVSMGKVEMYGYPKTHMVTVTNDVVGSPNRWITLDTLPADWEVGDEVVLTGHNFRRVSGEHSSQDELRTILEINSPQIKVSTLDYLHVRPESHLRFHVANLTRNIILRSESTETPNRGHVMLMDGRVDIRNVAFLDLGRTDKRVPLDDFIVTQFEGFDPEEGFVDYSIDPNTGTIENRRGRYSLHFHLNGTSPGSAPPSKVYNSVVRRTIGWGFVSHSSHVDFVNNVAHDFFGAGFVTEFGDELGNFTDNIAIRGKGDGEYRTGPLVFGNADRPQPLADFAFSGDGFWFQGPALRATGNVASGCDGAGMMWHTTGAPKVTARFSLDDTRCHNRYSGFNRSAADTVYSGFLDFDSEDVRNWDYDEDALVIADLPILESDGFEGYGNLVAFRLRFNNHNSLDWYDESGFDYGAQMENSPAVYARETVANLSLWNNEQAFSMRYVGKADWDTVEGLNKLDHTYWYSGTPTINSGFMGAEFFLQVDDSTITDIRIDGYEVATWRIANSVPPNALFVGDVTYYGSKILADWALEEGFIAGSSVCGTPTVSSITTISASRKQLNLTAGSGSPHRHRVRYRPQGTINWMYATDTSSAVVLAGLVGSTTYEYQVMSACNDTLQGTSQPAAVSNYTAVATFNN